MPVRPAKFGKGTPMAAALAEIVDAGSIPDRKLNNSYTDKADPV
jgi:hypothetical protein